MDFQAFVNDIETHRWNVYGAEVYRGGTLAEKYGDTTQSRYPVYSVTKGILSIAVGMACDEGKFETEKCILDYLPEKAQSGMNDAQRQSFRKITVERLLTMSVMGFPFRPEGESWLRFALNCPIGDVRTRGFDYSNIPAYLVGVALTNALEEDLYRYLDRKLFSPLQIREPVCGRCPEGYFYGASGLELTVRELSRIGLLLYYGGLHEGERIVSEEYVKRATSVRQRTREGGYGYFFWKYRDGFSINGKWGQKCYILPGEEKLVTFLSHMEEGSDAVRSSMEKNILS